MSDELTALLAELHGIVNNFSVTGDGVSGDLEQGYIVEFTSPWTSPADQPEGPEGPQPNFQT